MAGRPHDLTGQRFGRLVARQLAPQTGQHVKWVCQCDCGNVTTTAALKLKSGATRSCGCLQAETRLKNRLTHGACRHRSLGYRAPEWDTWVGMKERCYNQNATNYSRYGGAGITVCDEWRDDFAAFLRDMGPKPSPEHSIDRIDSSGPYAPWNCRWLPLREQAINRRNTRWVTYRGERRVMSHVAAENGVTAQKFWHHLKKCDWNADRAVARMLEAGRA